MDEKNKIKRHFKILLKIVLTVAVMWISFIVGIYFILISMSSNINIISTILGVIICPSLLLPLIYCKNKKKVLKCWIIFFIIFIIILLIDIGIKKYEESITINTSPNINTSEYLPFVENTKIVKLQEESTLKLTEELPILDGAAACFPMYSAFINAIYPNNVQLDRSGVFQYNNTVDGYKLLAEKETDIFFGGYPSEEQRQKAIEEGTEFEYTEIGKEAFVFFVHKDNPVSNLTTEQIKGIYSGKITNWKDVGGKDEKIIAFQRNPGSGSQSMLIRFMGNTPIMEAPKEQVNDFMSGIIEQVSHYKNTSSSIGFSFRYYLEGIIKNPNVKTISVDGIEPNKENIRDESYPITASVYAVTYKNNDNDNVTRLLEWILSEQGQEIVEKTGYVRIK
ncbi:MAG: substrate-binding domain-containing protein [Clostridia bacterium]|nr:substrate-binding domain-containing protein [Clostridia bacterium]